MLLKFIKGSHKNISFKHLFSWTNILIYGFKIIFTVFDKKIILTSYTNNSKTTCTLTLWLLMQYMLWLVTYYIIRYRSFDRYSLQDWMSALIHCECVCKFWAHCYRKESLLLHMVQKFVCEESDMHAEV